MKERRFVAIRESLFFVFTDIDFWADHEQELAEWCQQNNCVHKGMTVKALDEHAFVMFLLRWA